MQIARGIGNVVATVRHPAYDGHKLLLVQPLGNPKAPVRSVIVRIVDGIDIG